MPRHLHEIIAAMNAYAWTRTGPVRGPEHAPSYCAIGALLRHIGIPHAYVEQAALASLTGAYDALLRARYGISGGDTIFGIVLANGEAQSRAEATWRVLGLVKGTRESDNALPRTGGACSGPELPPAA